MEALKEKLLPLVKKYKYAALVLLVGVVLMLLPRGEKTEAVAAQEVPVRQATDETAQLETDLEALICQMDGAGKTKVLLTLEGSSERFYQTDERTSGEDVETTTVFSGSEEAPVVRRVRGPVYRGAVVVCQGADRASVRLQIVEAVSSLTGLGSDKIKVIKMKGQ